MKPLQVDQLRMRMNAQTLERFDEVWRMTFFPGLPGSRSIGSPSCLVPEHARQMAEHGIVRRADGPGPLSCVPFTVIEEKDGKLRQRLIVWTRDANVAAQAGGYAACVPLQHVSKYLPVSREPCGSTRDLRTGFYAVEVPEESRHLFRFRDADGSWWEMTRLPMGHTCAPELMHTLTAVSAGHPAYVLPRYAETAITVDVWVDNIRYAGSRKAVLDATRRLDQTARDCDLTWKDSDSTTAARRYEFIGVEFDHGTQRVAVSRKMKRKLAESRYALGAASMAASELETLGGRLLHASAVAGVFPGSFWFALKFLRRVTNALNRGARLPSDGVLISPSVRASLTSWVDAVLKPRAIPLERGPPSFTAFVDASKKGWGGVLVNARSAEISILGAKWTRDQSRLHINELEAMAFERVVRSLPREASGGRVDVVVDNTTVKGVARKGACLRSAVLNDAVVSALEYLRELRCAVSVRWVRSEGNPADLPSRVPLTAFTPQTVRSISQAVRVFFTGGVVDGK